MSWGVKTVKTTCFKATGVSLGGSGVSIGGVRSLRAIHFQKNRQRTKRKVLRLGWEAFSFFSVFFVDLSFRKGNKIDKCLRN